MKRGFSLVVTIVAAALCVHAAGAQPTWRTVDTSRFSIVFPATLAGTAAELAELADEVYASVSGYLGRDAPGRITLILREGVKPERPYPGVSGAPESPIELYAAPPTDPSMHDSSSPWLRATLAHELAIHLATSGGYGWSRILHVFGPDMRAVSAAGVPVWLREGVAVESRTATVETGRGGNPFFRLQLAAAVLAAALDEYPSLCHESLLPPDGRPVLGGYLLVDYVTREYGADAVRDIVARSLRRPVLGATSAVRAVTGVGVPTLYSRAVADWRARLAPSRAPRDDRIVTPPDGDWYLTRSGLGVYGGSDGSYRVYAQTRELLVDAKEALSSARRVSLDPHSIDASRHHVVGTVTRAERWRVTQEPAGSDLHELDAHSGKARRITSARVITHPSIAADSRTIVALEHDDGLVQLVGIHPETGSVTTIWKPTGATISRPAVSADGRLVAVEVRTDSGPGLAIVDAKSGSVTRLSAPGGVAPYFPVFPSQDRLWYTASVDSRLTLFEIDLQTLAVRKLLVDPVGVIHAALIDESIVYETLREGRHAVAVAPYETGPWNLKAVREDAEPADLPALTRIEAHGDRAYRDAPVPSLWLPLLLPDAAEGEPHLLAGAVIVATSPLGRHSAVIVPWARLSPIAAPGLAGSWRRVSQRWQTQLGWSIRTEGLAPDLRVDASGQAGVAYTVLADTGPLRSRQLDAAIVAGYGDPSNATASAGAASADLRVGLHASGTLAYRVELEARRLDLLGPAGFHARATALLAALGDGAGVEPGAEASFALRSPLGRGMLDVTLAGETRSPLAPDASASVAARVSIETPTIPARRPRRLWPRIGYGFRLYAEQRAVLTDAGFRLRPRTDVGLGYVVRTAADARPGLRLLGITVIVPHDEHGGYGVELTLAPDLAPVETLPPMVLPVGSVARIAF